MMSVPEKRKADGECSVEEQPELKKTQETNQPSLSVDGDEQDSYEIEDVKTVDQYKYSFMEWPMVLQAKIREGNEKDINTAFEKYLSQYVNDGDAWADYIEWMMRDKKAEELDKQKIETSFFKVLTKIYNIKLWRLYLRYVELINPITPDNAEKARSIVLKAYKFAIDAVGIEFFHSHELWGDYLKYLYLWQAVNPNEVSTREELISQALKTMIRYPSLNLEENWKTFTKFQTDLNLSKSKKVISDCKPEYLKLEKLNTELIKITKGIVRIQKRKATPRQLNKWKKWIEWEKQNKLKLKEEEVNKRINFVYNLSVQYCRLLPEVWFNYLQYLDKSAQNNGSSGGGENDDVKIELLKDGLLVNPKSLILTNELSKVYERSNKVDELKKVWKALIDNNISDGGDTRIITYCYCELMRIVNRICDIKEVRMVFKEARQYQGIEWNIFYEYCTIEYYNKETKIASRGFALGMQHFKDEISFVLKYLEFLINIKDMANFKKVMEVSIENFRARKDIKGLKRLFKTYYKVEDRFGDVKSIDLLMKRYLAIFGDFEGARFLYDSMKSEEDEFNAISELDFYRGRPADAVCAGKKGGAAGGEPGGPEDEADEEDEAGGDGGENGANSSIDAVMNGLKEDAMGEPPREKTREADLADKVVKLVELMQHGGEAAASVRGLSFGDVITFLNQ